MVGSAHVRRERVPKKPAAYQQSLEVLAACPHVQEVVLPPGQVLLYEGHIAPGCFVFWSGVLVQQSVLFGEQREIALGLDVLDSLEPGGEGGGRSPSGQVWVFPERVMLPVSLPFSLSSQTRTYAFFVPRSQVTHPLIHGLLERFSRVS